MKLFGGARPDHPMADRKEAARLLAELPPQELKALDELARLQESLGAAEGFKAEERAQRFALVDEAAQPRIQKLARDYLASVRSAKSSRGQENLVWTRLHEYWRQTAAAHARHADAKAPPAVVAGALHALGQQLKWQHLRYGPIDPAVWGELNRLYALAESRDIAEARIHFLRAAMFSAAAPDTLPALELEIAERITGALAPAFAIGRAPALQLPCWIDLAKPMAPSRVSRGPQPSADLRYFGPGGALGSLQEMIGRLEAERQAPVELGLAPDDEAEAVLGVLRHLSTYWAPVAPERRHKRHQVQSKLTIAHGLDGVIEALGGSPDDSLNFGARAAGEQWAVDNVSASGFGALAPLSKSDWVKVGTLVAAQPDGTGTWQVGMVRRVARISKDEVRIGVETLSRAPAVKRFSLRNAREATGLLLPPLSASAGDAAVALRAGVIASGETLEASVDNRRHLYMPQGVSERAGDCEIVKCREMVRES